MTYEWDLVKAAANVKTHHVTFEEGASVFLDPSALTFSVQSETIGPGLFTAILRDCEIQRDEFIALL